MIKIRVRKLGVGEVGVGEVGDGKADASELGVGEVKIRGQFGTYDRVTGSQRFRV